MSRKNTDVLKAIAVTAELTNTEMSESALEVFEADLAERCSSTAPQSWPRSPAADASFGGA